MPPGPRRRLADPIPRAAAIVALVLVLGGLAFATVEDVRAHIALSDTRGQLAGTQAQLRATASSLTSTRRDLETAGKDLTAARSSLQSVQADLQTRTQERDTARQQLADAQQQLTGVRNTVQADRTEIGRLTTCLAGVTAAMDAIPDYTTAAGDLQAVQAVCEQAAANLPT